MKSGLVFFAVVCSLVLTVPRVHSQNGSLQWAKRAGGNNNDEPNAVTVDTNGNVFVTGYFRSTATFGPGESNQALLTTFGQEPFLAKYNAEGQLVWARQMKGAFGIGAGVGVDGPGNSYVFGYYSGNLVFADGETNEVTLSALANDLFLAKYDPNGKFVWAKKAGGTFSEYAHALATDTNGNCFITGRYGSDPIIFAPGETNETQLAALNGDNGEDIFVAKYNSNGILQWAKRAGGATGNRGTGIALDAVGNSYVVGRYSGTSTFGTGESRQSILNGPLGGSDEIFVAKFATNGLLRWVRPGFGGPEHDQGNAIAVDAAGNSVIVGTFRGFMVYGELVNQTQRDRGGSADIFIMRHDTEGNQTFVKFAVGPLDETALGVAMDRDGNAYVVGSAFTVIFGAEEPSQVELNSLGSQDTFLAKIDSFGSTHWARLDGGNADDRAHAIAFGSGAVHVVGKFGQTATFGAGQINETALQFAGAADIFLAKYSVTATNNPVSAANFTEVVMLLTGTPRLTLTGTEGATYRIERTGTLTTPHWVNAGTVTIGAGGSGALEDVDGTRTAPSFYRAVAQ